MTPRTYCILLVLPAVWSEAKPPHQPGPAFCARSGLPMHTWALAVSRSNHPDDIQGCPVFPSNTFNPPCNSSGKSTKCCTGRMAVYGSSTVLQAPQIYRAADISFPPPPQHIKPKSFAYTPIVFVLASVQTSSKVHGGTRERSWTQFQQVCAPLSLYMYMGDPLPLDG
uniref:Uncharacterized protein n=1 Tax=Eutreptiella gymnastica TaxID=73025 RepID=A0A7S4D2D6_9EUGL